MKVQIIGLGYIGLPTLALIASKNISVHGVDINEKIIENLKSGITNINEPGLDDYFHSGLKNNMISLSTKPEIADIHLIVVPTPFKNNYEPDISFVESATKSLLPVLKPNDLFIIESTSPVGTTEKIEKLIYSAKPELTDKIFISYCPERVLPGKAIFELESNDRVIGGVNEISSEKAKDFYSYFVKGALHMTNSRTAELCKLTENSSRDVQIAFANELSLICEKANINVWELISLANKHPRVNILNPGSGVGGHCIAVDPYFIISSFENESKMISQARKVNNYKPKWCVEKTIKEIDKFNNINNRNAKVALLGLAFKADIEDLRESPALNICEQILNYKQAEYFIVEPNIKSHKDFELSSLNKALVESDIIVFLVSHKEFKNITINNSQIVLDFSGTKNNYK